jgi:hypothetical protein
MSQVIEKFSESIGSCLEVQVLRREADSGKWSVLARRITPVEAPAD